MPVLPDPQPGLVVAYDYLWRDEALRGQESGGKTRPCVILLAVRKQAGAIVVTVAPVTHRPPGNAKFALEIPATTKRRLGLDDQRSWIVLHDLNQFVWPGTDLRAVAGGNDSFAYGALPRSLYNALRDRILALFREGPIATTYRTP